MSHTTPPETPFERAERWLDTWDGTGPPLERVVYRSKKHGVTALLDPFSPLRLGVVVYPHVVAEEGQAAHLANLERSQRTSLDHVVHAVGAKLLAACSHSATTELITEQRVLERVDGFAVPRQAHVRMGVGYRNEEDAPRPTPEELDRNWGLLQIIGDEKNNLDCVLDAQALIGQLIDNPGAPETLRSMARIATVLG